MENIKKAAPYGFAIFVIWIGLDAATAIYEAYEAICSDNPMMGCKSFYNSFLLLRLIVLLGGIAGGYMLHGYLSWLDNEKAKRPPSQPVH